MATGRVSPQLGRGEGELPAAEDSLRRRPSHHPLVNAVLAALVVLVLLLPLWQRTCAWYRDFSNQIVVGNTLASAHSLATGISRELGFRLARVQQLDAFVQREAGSADFAEVFATFAAELTTSHRLPHGSTILVAPQGTVRYVYPESGSAAFIGYNPMMDELKELRIDAQSAADTGELTLSGPLRRWGERLELIAWQAVYRDGRTWGLVAVVFDVDALLAEIGPSFAAVGPDGNELYIQAALRDNMGQVFAGDPNVIGGSAVSVDVPLGNELWELSMLPSSSWTRAVASTQRAFEWGGLVIVLLTTLLTYQTVNRQTRLQRAVARRTRELEEANVELREAHELLEQRVAQRTHTLQRRADQFHAISQIGRRITNLMELDELMGQAVRLIQETFSYYHVGLGLVEGNEVLYRAGAGILWDDPTFGFRPRRLKIGQEGMTGWVAGTGESLLARDVAQEPHYVQMAGSQTRSELVLPIVIQGEVIGVLDIQSEKLDAFDDTDRLVLQVLADQIGVAIENARLYAQTGTLAALEERQRLARELHDSVSQAIYGISLGTQTILEMVEQTPEASLQTATAPLNYITSLSEAALSEMRALIFQLRPESLEKEGLIAALEKQTAAVRARHRLAVETELCAEPAVSLAVKEAFYRVAQEALHNVVKHAEANTIHLVLWQANGQLYMKIQDDGRGFDPGRDYPGHLGLRSMHERMEAAGGTLTISSAPGSGASIRAAVRVSGTAETGALHEN